MVRMAKAINHQVVPCPCCKKPLFRTVANEDSVNEMAVGTSHFELDQNGPFMKCQHCSSRIVLESLPGSKSQWRTADHQDCT